MFLLKLSENCSCPSLKCLKYDPHFIGYLTQSGVPMKAYFFCSSG
uniref:Uncharacterized protein n=1 Tax=Manihot esculenta TaxID=3983 RepID=A0A2C9UH39_MANES